MGKSKKSPKAPASQAALPLESEPPPASTTERAVQKPARRATAETMASKQREISVSEFFTKNRHLLGFDNPAKSLLTTIKEAVDNALDACEEAGILPDLVVEIKEVSEGRFRVAVEDNGPGIVKPQIPKIFAKLLYGSKFHRLKQSLTWEQPVLVEVDGVCRRVPIGELVDRFVQGDGEGTVDVTASRMRAPAFDPTSLRYAWRPVSHVIRHERHNEILEVRTQQGKRVRVTGCHSLFGYDPATRRVRAVEARSLRPGDYVVAPRRLPGAAPRTQVNLLDEISAADVRTRWVYVYGVAPRLLASLAKRAQIVHAKKNGRSRRYFRFVDRAGDPIDVLDDSFRQYEAKGFLPAWLVKRLGLERECARCVLRTFRHGDICETPVSWALTPTLARLLGLYVAEGHGDRRQIDFTFALHERDTLAQEVVRTAGALGLRTSIEVRPSSLRVKVFGGLTDLLFPRWCGGGAKRRRVPSFVFGATPVARQAFLDALYQGDGHRVATREVLVLTTSSEGLAGDVEALWLLQGVVAARRGPHVRRGPGKSPSLTWSVEVRGADIAASDAFERRAKRRAANRYAMFPGRLLSGASASVGERVATGPEGVLRAAGLGLGPAGPAKSLGIVSNLEVGRRYEVNELSALAGGRVTRHLADHMARLGYLARRGQGYLATPKVEELRDTMSSVSHLASSDVCLLRVEAVDRVDSANRYVYDLSVPGCENFVAGAGPLACHNSRGQQGIGISAAGLYGQLTTGKPVVIISKTGKGRPAFRIDLRIDTKRNQPDVVKDESVEWNKDHGTRVEIELVGAYRGGRTGVDAYLEQTVIANPHLALTYVDPKNERREYPRVADELPREAQEIKPHPHGVELGMLMTMLQDSPGKTVSQVLKDDFSRVSPAIAQQVCEIAKVSPRMKADAIHSEDAERLHQSLGQVRVMAPPASCVVPIGEGLLVEGLKRRFKAEFYTSTTRPPAVYRGNPFVVEVGLAYGGELPLEEQAEIIRFANRVPLQYQPKACAISESVYDLNWKAYTLPQPKGGLPVGPLAIVVHLASVWVPFTSEAKEAVAHYDELLKEMKLALQECGRKLGAFLRARERAASEQKRRSIFLKYIPEVSAAIGEIVGQESNKIEKAFFAALPNFVRLDDEGDGEPPPPSGGAAPAPGSMPPPAGRDSVAPPAMADPSPKAKGKEKARPRPAAPSPTAKDAAKGKAAPEGKAKNKGGRGEQLALI